MPEGRGKARSLAAEKRPPSKKTGLGAFFQRLKERRVIETLAAFIGGGWLLVEVVERLLVNHYHFPEKTIDLTVISVIGALTATLVWRWFGGTEKRPGNIKVEVLFVPLIILAAAAIDINLVLQMTNLPVKALLIGIVALCLGIVWVILKLSQWAAAGPHAEEKRIDVSDSLVVRPEKSIVVLPFTDLSPQKDQDYFCDGMTEEIITDLSQVPGLLVVSRASAMTLKGKCKTAGEISKELNVRYVLEGSVRKAENDLRITAQLIDASTDAHLWAEKYTGSLDAVFDIQEKVSRSIVSALKLMTTPEELRRIGRLTIPNIKAYEAYLKALHEIFSLTGEGLKRALTYLNNALDIIGENPVLNAALGLVYWQYVNLGIEGVDQEEFVAKTQSYAHRSLALDPECSQAHVLLGLIDFLILGNLKGTVRRFKKALIAEPNDVNAMLMLALAYCEAGKLPAAQPLLVKCLEIDPVNPLCYLHQSGAYFFEGRFDKALDSSSRAFKMSPEVPFYSFWHALMLAYNRRCGEALSMIELGTQVTHQDFQTKLSLFLKYVLQNEKGKIMPLLDQEFILTAKRDMQWSYLIASFFAKLNEPERALDWLEQSFQRGFINYPMIIEGDPWLAGIRGEGRFKKLMERVEYEWEHFEE